MMLNKPMFDWLTLTTFDEKNALGVKHGLIEERKPAKRLQYKGVEDRNKLFVGHALQNGEDHWMFQASGEMSDYAHVMIIRNFGPYDWNVTRCDLQVTVPMPAGFDSRAMYDALVAWEGDGKPRKPSIVQSGDGNDTVYIGSRTSDRFTRIYVKPLEEGSKALRFEVEYKGEHAHRVYNDCRRAEKKREILAHELWSLPRLPKSTHRAFYRVLGNNLHKPEIKRADGQHTTLEWLTRQVSPTVARMANGHETHWRMREIVLDWCRMCGIDTNQEGV